MATVQTTLSAWLISHTHTHRHGGLFACVLTGVDEHIPNVVVGGRLQAVRRDEDVPSFKCGVFISGRDLDSRRVESQL